MPWIAWQVILMINNTHVLQRQWQVLCATSTEESTEEDDQALADSLVLGDDGLEGVGSRRNPGKDDIP